MTSKRAQYFIREYHDRPVSKRELLRLQGEEMEKTCVEQKYLVKHKIVSLGQIRRYERDGLLKPTYYMRKKYFKKDELAAVLVKDDKTTSRGQQAGLFEK
jgi:hypothetical protein